MPEGLARWPELVIFDCDGVLVDSERLNVQTWRGMMTDLGIDLNDQQIVETFVGKAYADNRVTIQEMTGAVPDPEWERRWRAQFRRSHERLEPIAGIRGAVEALLADGSEVSVASGSLLSAIAFKLERTGLVDLFAEEVRFSAEQVERGKPAPDVFLLTARTLGVAPERCVVVEDSAAGVRAGRAAGMPVVGYASDMTPAGWLDEADVVIDDMRELPAAVAALPASSRAGRAG